VLTTGRILSNAAAADDDNDVGGRLGGHAIVLQYIHLLHARVVTIHGSLKCAADVWGSELAITWTWAVISC